MSMFCNQCEQAANGTGCNISGVCGKKPDVAALQDHLLYGLKSLALYADKLGRNAEIDRFTIEGLFTTVTNVDFDAAVIGGMIKPPIDDAVSTAPATPAISGAYACSPSDVNPTRSAKQTVTSRAPGASATPWSRARR